MRAHNCRTRRTRTREHKCHRGRKKSRTAHRQERMTARKQCGTTGTESKPDAGQPRPRADKPSPGSPCTDRTRSPAGTWSSSHSDMWCGRWFGERSSRPAAHRVCTPAHKEHTPAPHTWRPDVGTNSRATTTRTPCSPRGRRATPMPRSPRPTRYEGAMTACSSLHTRKRVDWFIRPVSHRLVNNLPRPLLPFGCTFLVRRLFRLGGLCGSCRFCGMGCGTNHGAIPIGKRSSQIGSPTGWPDEILRSARSEQSYCHTAARTTVFRWGLRPRYSDGRFST